VTRYDLYVNVCTWLLLNQFNPRTPSAATMSHPTNHGTSPCVCSRADVHIPQVLRSFTNDRHHARCAAPSSIGSHRDVCFCHARLDAASARPAAGVHGAKLPTARQ